MKRKLQSITSKLPAIITMCLILLIWQMLCSFEIIPKYMLPSPVSVLKALISEREILWMHLKISLTESLIGLGLGILIAFLIATVMDRFDILYRAINPILIITQTIPTIAIAPILVLWMGFGMAPKITLVVITTFFPIAVGLMEGYRSVDRDQINLLKAMGARRLQIFYHAKLPATLPYFFSGLKISASYAVVGAVVSEWLGGFEGLGVYMTRVKKAYAFDKMFAVIVVIIIISLLLMKLVTLTRHFIMPWENSSKQDN